MTLVITLVFKVTLANASYKGLEGQELAAKLKPEFEEFLRARAKLFHSAIGLLA
jgi:hypothetical protein